MSAEKTGFSHENPPACIVLAAGKGVRMKSARPKVLHEIGGRPMLLYSIDRAFELGCNPVVAVLGNGAELIKPVLPENVNVAIQKQQLGTGHATQCGMDAIDRADRVLVLYGDTPLLTGETLKKLLDVHSSSGKELAMLTAMMSAPNRLGRVVRGPDGVDRVVEAADAGPDELAIKEVNAGIYVAGFEFLKRSLNELKSDNAQGEYYLTDVVQVAAGSGGGVLAHVVDDYTEVLGINDRIELAAAERELNRRTLRNLMASGVTLIDPEHTYVQPSVSIGSDSVLYPGAVIEGKTVIGRNCVVGPGVMIRNSEIGNEVEVRAHSVIDLSKVGDETTVGPSAHLRPDSVIGPRCRIGNFVETKKVNIDEGTKASHLTYLGDAQIGKNVNIGCGTITCNYDGHEKHLTIIEDEVFVGSDTQFVAPVKIGRGAYIASGSTVTKDVPPRSLSVSRAKQRDIPGGGERLRKRKKK